ncbi:SbcC/MukB-like Walker B domain-containing protein [Rothia kristinae]|uniref:SbcC/MukB-like Walker B domain-containing protein n=1 Tax=Rothia kristinae TaxID=37923 RepID=UPI0007363970|nr:SbcC/MukB-like Walker B domain-containing protein [Rothia kristinae]
MRAAEQAERRAEQHRGRAQRLAQELDRLRERLRGQELEHRDLQTRGAQARERARSARARRGGDPRDLLDSSTLRTRLAAAEDLERLLERVLGGLEARSRTARRRTRSARAGAQAAREAGFADVPEALARSLDPQRRGQLRRTVAAEEQERARLEEAWQAPAHRRLLEEAQRAEAEGLDAASITDPQRRGELVEQAARREAAAQEEHERVLLTRERAQQLLADLRELAVRWGDWARRSGRRAERARRIGDLAEVAAGNGAENLQRMSLTTYVLAAQLEEIAEAASLRLQQMSSGRYTLRHSDAAAGHGRRSGLGLEVFDAWSSVARPTSSLSGGESFMASLCLALGLADVVQARAGGVQIDTLFVDEGFGSLDEDTLEDVMDAIDGLRENGRVIGLISHVADLRARIPQHLRVRRTPAGSLIESDAG